MSKHPTNGETDRRAGDERRESERRKSPEDRRSGLGFRPEPDRRAKSAEGDGKTDRRRRGSNRRKPQST